MSDPKQEAKEQERIAMLSLTAADVERGIYKATGKDFDDVVFFNSAKEALSYLAENKRDVIISDYMMPEMNGLEFLSEAKKLSGINHISF